ncbi:MAG: biotin/lipoyl-binding protein, partial [Betaproteobacteria bacterium]
MSDVAPWLKRIAIALGAIIALGAAGWLLFAPTPPEVEGATALRGSMQVTVDQEAEVRVHDRYVVAAPVSGRLRRVDLHDGDPVAAGQVLALIDPAPLDPRTRAEALARVDAAQALLREAEQNVQQALSARDQARRDRDRAARLADERFVAAEVAERARTTAASAEAAAAA